MKVADVRIVRLEPLRVACAHGFGSEPEKIAHEKINAFIAERGLDDYRHFGFNNPSPSPGSSNYGYDIWITVGPDVVGTDEVEIKEFEGGLYGVSCCEGVQNLGSCWQALANWRDDSAYSEAQHQWLENLLTDPALPSEAYVFDLYIPIAE